MRRAASSRTSQTLSPTCSVFIVPTSHNIRTYLRIVVQWGDIEQLEVLVISIAPAVDIVHVWMEQGTPARLVWAGVRYRAVSASPIRVAAHHDALTHPGEHLVGWSVIAQREHDAADTRVFQLQRHSAGWILVDVDPE